MFPADESFGEAWSPTHKADVTTDGGRRVARVEDAVGTVTLLVPVRAGRAAALSVLTHVLDEWEQLLTGLENDPMRLADRIDWVAKYRLIEGLRERHGMGWDDARLRAFDLQYHDIRPEKSLSARARLARILNDADIEEAVTEPPPDTRAYFRGKCLQRFGPYIAAANWDSIVFDLGSDPLRRVPMLEPLRGTAAHVATLLEGCSTPAELLSRLGN